MQLSRAPGWIWWLFRFSFISLPYLYFAVFPGVIAVIGLLWHRFRRSALDRSTNLLLLAIVGLLLLSSLFAANRAEAFLQLANFLPYLLLFAVLPYLLQSTERLVGLATDVVILTIPINLLALLEYVLRAEGIPRWLRRTELSRWYRARPHAGRAMVMFGHPNALAGYLVLVLGLGLGLILYRRLQHSAQLKREASDETFASWRTPKWQTILLYIGTSACLLGIYASGSRNGLIVAIVQLLIFSLFTKASRFVWLAGLAGLVGLVAIVAQRGIGGRTLNLADWADDPRVGVWRFALNLLGQRPLLGWGLGNFKLQYPPGLIPDYKYIAHPHNFWLLLAVEAGLPLMILLTLLVGRICYRAVRQLGAGRQAEAPEKYRRAALLAYLLSFGGCVTFALFDVTFYDARINLTNWVVLAGLYSLTELKYKTVPSNLEKL